MLYGKFNFYTSFILLHVVNVCEPSRLPSRPLEVLGPIYGSQLSSSLRITLLWRVTLSSLITGPSHTFLMTTLQFDYSLCTILPPSLLHKSRTQAHSPVSFCTHKSPSQSLFPWKLNQKYNSNWGGNSDKMSLCQLGSPVSDKAKPYRALATYTSLDREA